MNKLNTIDQVEIIKLQKIVGRDANMTIFDKIDKYFIIKRVFTVNNNILLNKRGHHAHKNCKQIITCPYGSIKFKVYDGKRSKIFKISNNNKAIYVPNYIWTETTYLSENATLVCYCSNYYNEKSYMRDIVKFLKIRAANF